MRSGSALRPAPTVAPRSQASSNRAIHRIFKLADFLHFHGGADTRALSLTGALKETVMIKWIILSVLAGIFVWRRGYPWLAAVTVAASLLDIRFREVFFRKPVGDPRSIASTWVDGGSQRS